MSGPLLSARQIKFNIVLNISSGHEKLIACHRKNGHIKKSASVFSFDA
jgi:hypothetical protein